jgi:CheY-like chemotaxis protein
MRSSVFYRAQVVKLGNPILLVDDHADGLAARRSVLEELGYTVVTAGSGPDALEQAGKRAFDLVIADHKMLPMSGVELIARLRQRDFRKPIILLSGFVECLGLSEQATGADLVIQKSANEIARLIRSAQWLLGVPKKPPRPALSGKKPRVAC